MELRPAEIAMRQFSKALYGANLDEVKAFLAEVAAAVDRLNSEVTRISLERVGLQTAVKAANAEADELRQQLAAAAAKVAAYQEQESQMARALMDVQKVTEEMIESSRAQAEAAVADAKATAEATLQSARKEAADLLRDARTRAEEAVQAAERAAATRIAQAQIDSERLIEQARQAARELQQAAEQWLQGLISKIEAALSDNAGLSRHLELLAKTHADSLETVASLQAVVKDDILPGLRQLLGALKNGEASPATPGAPAASSLAAPPRREGGIRPRPVPSPAVSPRREEGFRSRPVPPPAAPPQRQEAVHATPVPPPAVPPPQEEAAAATPVSPPAAPPQEKAAAATPAPPPAAPPPREEAAAATPAPPAGGERDWGAQPKGEIVVSPVHSFLQASKLVTAISRMKGVTAARFRAYSGGVVTIEVLTESGTLTTFDTALIDGFPTDVVESTDSRLVLRIAKGSPKPG